MMRLTRRDARGCPLAGGVVLALLCVLACAPPPPRVEAAFDLARPGRPFSRLLLGQNLEWVGAGEGVWSPQLGGPDPKVAEVLDPLRFPLLRFPGGGLAEDYHWREGVGPRARRPKGTYGLPMDFGTDEFLAYCRRSGAEPMITVSFHGGPTEAARWVEYVNGPASSPMGRLRASYGHPASYAVRYWEVGNELYEPYYGISPTAYASGALAILRAMRNRSPSIRLGLVARHNRWDLSRPSAWDAALFASPAREADLLLVHLYAPGMNHDTTLLLGGETPRWGFASAGGAAPQRLEWTAFSSGLNGEGPTTDFSLDGRSVARHVWKGDDQGHFVLPVTVAAGPHQVSIRMVNPAHRDFVTRSLLLSEVRWVEGPPPGLLLDREGSRRDEAWGPLLAAPVYLQRILEGYRRWIEAAGLAGRLRLAVTEYNAYLGPFSRDRDLGMGLAGSLFVADALLHFMEEESIEAANFWAVRSDTFFRLFDGCPEYGYYLTGPGVLFRFLAGVLGGRWVPGRVRGATFDTLPYGPLPEERWVPLVSAWAFRRGEAPPTLLILNRSLGASVRVDLSWNAYAAGPTAGVAVYGGEGPDAINTGARPGAIAIFPPPSTEGPELRFSEIPLGDPPGLVVPPLSVTAVRLTPRP